MKEIKRTLTGTFFDPEHTMLTFSTYDEESDDLICEIELSCEGRTMGFFFEKKHIHKLSKALNELAEGKTHGKSRNF